MTKRLAPPGVIAVDGPAGAGKSSAAKGLAKTLGYRHIDTGAMYRAMAWAALDSKTDLTAAALVRLARKTKFDFSNGGVSVNGTDVATAIRTAEVTSAASQIAVWGALRNVLVAKQRLMGRGGRVVMEGRDVGTVVFPKAPIKFFLDAQPEERARRRWRELRAAGKPAPYKTLLAAIRERDHRDRTRAVAPLKPALDAFVIDSTGLTLRQVQTLLLKLVKEKSKKKL